MPTWLIIIIAIVCILFILHALFAAGLTIFAICAVFKPVLKLIKEIWNESKS